MNAIAGKAHWAIVARRALLGAAILVMTGQTTFAAPTALVCRRSGSLGPDVFTLNETQRTVTIAFAGTRNDDGSVSPPRSTGPLSATFADNSITISHDHKYYGYSPTTTGGSIDTYVIDRVAATMELTQVYNGNVIGHAVWTCRVGQKQF